MTELSQRVSTASGSDRVPMDVVNLQRKVKIELSPIRAFAAAISEYVTEAGTSTFTVAFIDDARMRELNETFRGKDTTTDVLSFPHEPFEFESKNAPPYEGGVAAASADGVVLSPDALTTQHSPLTTFLGDIVISAETAERQAAENGLDLETEIKQLILHGLLHLCGYDHETDQGQMDTRELELRKKLGI